MELLRLLGGTVCHQLPDRTLGCAGELMALCARCTGVYVGILLLLLYLASRRQLGTRRFPPLATYAIALLALGAAGADILLANQLALYRSAAWLRLLTGLWAGIGLTVICLPVFNCQLVRAREPEPSSPLTPGATLVLLLLAPLLMALLLAGGQSPGGVLGISVLTIAVMTAVLVYILTTIVHATLTIARPNLPRRPAFLLAVILFLLLVFAIRALHGS